MTNILITGSEGQLGKELKIVASKYKEFKCIFTDIDTLDITDNTALKAFFNNNKIDYIVNCAAYTLVDKAETDKANAEKINTTAVTNLVKIANNFQVKFIQISTDYVFDGKENTPYTEASEVNPQTVYGSTKLMGEIEAQRYINTIIIRTSWLYSQYGNNFVKTIMKLANDKKEINVVMDQVGSPTYAADLASAIFEIIIKSTEDSNNFKKGIYNFSNEGVCSWFDFATEIIKISKSECIIKPCRTNDFPAFAKRPKYSVLDKTKIKTTYNIPIPYWRDSLEKCIEKLNDKN